MSKSLSRTLFVIGVCCALLFVAPPITASTHTEDSLYAHSGITQLLSLYRASGEALYTFSRHFLNASEHTINNTASLIGSVFVSQPATPPVTQTVPAVQPPQPSTFAFSLPSLSPFL
ncbi:hypothetical protein COU15_00625, partial [Candidatus Kaiserbacteria bacterium CG10_big_fil_rev_8_21_14_0_10_45_20]